MISSLGVSTEKKKLFRYVSQNVWDKIKVIMWNKIDLFDSDK